MAICPVGFYQQLHLNSFYFNQMLSQLFYNVIQQYSPYISGLSRIVANDQPGSGHAGHSHPILASKHLMCLNVSQLYLCIESAVKSELYISQ